MKKENKGKRYNGEGSIRQRDNGRWELIVMIGYHPDGRRKYKTFCGSTQQEVKKKYKEYQMSMAKGLNLEEDYTLGEWLLIWFERHKKYISPTTAEGYKYTIRRIERYLGKMKIRNIKAWHVEDMLEKCQEEGLSKSSLEKTRGLCFQALEKAEAYDLILKNPCRFINKLQYDKKPTPKESFTVNELRILMQELPLNKIGNSTRLMLGTGVRGSEILSLRPDHIEPDGSAIYIEEVVRMVGGKVTVGPPKSENSRRKVVIPQNLKWCAIKLRETDGQYVWESERKPGQPVNVSHFRKLFREALEAVPGVRVLTPHCCRHTFVSQLYALGVQIEVIQRMIGHADIDMTKHYLHLQPEVISEAVEKFNEAFLSGVSKEMANKDV